MNFKPFRFRNLGLNDFVHSCILFRLRRRLQHCCNVATYSALFCAVFCALLSTIPSSLCHPRSPARKGVLPVMGRRRFALRSQLGSGLLQRCGGAGPAPRTAVPLLRAGRQGEVALGFLQPDVPVRRKLYGFQLRRLCVWLLWGELQ